MSIDVGPTNFTIHECGITGDSKDDGQEESNIDCLLEEARNALECQGVVFPHGCEQFIARCLRVKNYDVTKAAILVKNFGQMMGMSDMADLFANFKPTLIQGLYKNMTVYPLAKRDLAGRLVIVAHASCWNPMEYDFDQALAAVIMVFNFGVAHSVQVQREGVIFILDFSGWNLQQLRAASLKRLKIVVRLLQNSTPGKIKAIHLINYPRVIKLIFALVKPFLKSKLSSRIHFHGDDVNSLQANFEPALKVLPESLGGVAGDECVDNELLDLLLQQDQYYQDLVELRYPAY